MIRKKHNLGGIVFTVSRVILILSLSIIAVPTAAPFQSTASSASLPPGPEPLLPMPADANPSFDVATIKPSDTSAPHGTFFRTNGRHVVAYNISVDGLIAYAYGLHERQIVDGPSSLLSTHFDIDGLPDIEGHPNLKQSRLMFQKLLLSRFKLAFHNQSRELPAYAIQIAKDGPKLALTTRKPGDSTNFSYNCQVVLTVRNASIADVAKGMQEVFMDRPVVDQTGLRARYDFDLKWTPDESQSYCPVDPARSRDEANAPPGLYTAIQEQLGLKLIRTKAPIQVMVIDHVETPSEN
jgi:uncharacterized protein (TIGR03435 family)